MRILWAPWRMKYVRQAVKTAKEECFLCRAAKAPVSEDEKLYVLRRSKSAFIILNIYPYNTGHLMIAPYKHEQDPLELSDEEALDMIQLLKLSIKALRKVYLPDAFNIGANIGRDAGAGVEDHFHIHVVPRWRGDTNFMPVISQTKVIPQALDETYRVLRSALRELQQ
uniref:HIT domain-containing protein n=1 Tax=Fervidicoccus fontis TaxID=683846 RepID=A0A7J3ZKX4_9CREN